MSHIYNTIMANNCDTELGLFLDVQLNTNCLEQDFINRTEAQIIAENCMGFSFHSEQRRTEFYENFKCYVLENERLIEEDIYDDFVEFVEEHLNDYDGYIEIEVDACHEDELEDLLERCDYYRRINSSS